MISLTITITILVAAIIYSWALKRTEDSRTEAMVVVRPPARKHDSMYLRKVEDGGKGFSLAEALTEALDDPAEVPGIHKALLAKVSGPRPGMAFKDATYVDSKYRIYASIIQEPWFETTTFLRVEYLAG